MRFLRSGVKRGLVAGALAAGFLTWFERLEERLLGGMPRYHPHAIAARLVSVWTRRHLTPRTARRFGLAIRWVYAPLLGAVYGLVQDRLPSSERAAGLAFGAGIFRFERAALPLTRATAPWRTWSRKERLLLRAHAMAFGLATVMADRALRALIDRP